MTFYIIWPERRFLTAAQIRRYFCDAVANGDIVITEMDTYADLPAMARALSDAGLFTFAQPSRGLEEPV